MSIKTGLFFYFWLSGVSLFQYLVLQISTVLWKIIKENRDKIRKRYHKDHENFKYNRPKANVTKAAADAYEHDEHVS